ncbi:MAG TPA: ribokinase, partial [Gammaproteobacteria bacterium]|nr:ribokinase [Gammaproteobacteria bacterium]
MGSGCVVVVGAINTDLVITAAHLPAPGETVVGGGLQTFAGGKGANAAVAASRAGAGVYLIGAVGADDAGKRALAELVTDDVDTRGVAVLDDEPTGAALIVVDAEGENQIAIGPGANGAVSREHVSAALAELVPSADIVLVSTEIPIAAVGAAVEAAAKAGVQCMVNPAPVISGLVDLLPLHPIVTPNEIELRDLALGLSGASAPGSGDDIPKRLQHLGEQTHAPVIVTLGGEGCVVRLADGEVRRISARTADNVVDTTGAGDTFNGVLAAHLAAGDAIMTAVSTAVVAASLSVATVGARP